MEAYAALVSLMHTINSIANLPHSRYPVSLNKNQEESLVKNVTFFQEFLEDTSNLRYEANYIERRIAGAANAAEDIIDQLLMDAVKSTSHGKTKLYECLNDVVEDMDRMKKEAMEIKEKIATVKQIEAGIHDLKISEVFPPRDESLSHSKTRFVLPSKELLGREYDTKVLLSKLIDLGDSDVQLSVIPIVGGCGIGKTALARMVYEEGSVREHFELRAWVKVEERELNMKHAAHRILESAMGMQCSLDDLDELDEMVRDTLQSHRCLIVFDGIDSMSKDSWLHMNHCWFHSLDLGSKIIITTQSEDVGVLVAEQSFELKQLSLEDGWSLVKSVALDALPLKDKESVAACCGNPLLLKLFGSLIRYDYKISDIAKNMLSPSAITLLCIRGLPSHLKQCLAYCTLFPKGCELNKGKIVDMWIADGLIKPYVGKSNNKRYFLDIAIGNAYFHQLMSRSFFTDITRDPYNDVVGFRIPSLIRENMKDDAGNIYKGKLGLIGSLGEDAAQLSLVSPGEYDWHNLRTLIMSPTLYLGGSPDHESSLLDFLELRSLDLSCSGIKNLSGDIRVLRELRYLNLSYTLIESLPDSITDLSSLETLDLSWCYHLKVLPKKLGCLKLMSHLDLSRCETLSSFPSGIDFLVNLSSMPLFVLGKDKGCARLGDLGRLNQLQGNLEIRNLENVKEIYEAGDAKLYNKRLRHLELQWNRDGYQSSDCFRVLELLMPNQQLKVLNLIGYNGFEFPKWISSMKSLIKIFITDCGCEKLPSLGQLPFLKELQLKGFPQLRHIGEEFYGERNADADAAFQSLELLQLYDLPELFKWEWSGASIMNAFLSLKSLTMEDCPRLETLPPFPTLQDLILSNCHEFIFYYFPRFESLRSLLISSVRDWRWHLLGGIKSVKKLILHNVGDKKIVLFMINVENRMTALEHLGIHHCSELTDVFLEDLVSLKKLHIVNCQELNQIRIFRLQSRLMEIVLEDCPQLYSFRYYYDFPSLRKLVVRNCRNLDIDRFIRKFAKELQYLSISGCPELETQLPKYSGKLTHDACMIVGNLKVNYKNTKKELSKAGPGLSVKRRTDLPSFINHLYHKSSQRLRKPRGGETIKKPSSESMF